MKTIRNTAPSHHRTIFRLPGGEEVVLHGGEAAEVPDELAEELATQPGLDIEIVEASPGEELERLTRAQLNELAESLGLDPSGYRTKDAVSAAIREAQAAQAQAEEPDDGHDNDHKED